jgi:hypothetical protein
VATCGRWDFDCLQVGKISGLRMKRFAFDFLIAIIAGLISAWLFEKYYARIRQRFIDVRE